MNILHVTNHLSRTGGGTPAVIWPLAAAQVRLGARVGIVAMQDPPNDSEDFPDSRSPGLDVRTYPQSGPFILGWSRALHNAVVVAPTDAQPDLVHQHGLWSLLSLTVKRWRKRHRRPSVVSPHGMLDDWALQNRRPRKMLFGALIENANLRRADCIHALCEAEADAIRRYGLRNPIALVSSGIDPPDYAPSRATASSIAGFPRDEGKRRMLFMSRLHPKKGIPMLLQAWASSAREEWQLVIAGRDQLNHRSEMEALTRKLDIATSVFFTGPLYGDSKKIALAAVDAMVLPSHSEGFPVALLEGAASALPCLITTACNFPSLAAAGGAVEVAPEAQELAEALPAFLDISASDLSAMGQRGRNHVIQEYAWSHKAEAIHSVYTWLLGGGAAPACVRLD